MVLTAAEQLTYSTIRIVCDYADGTSGTGTGFIYNFHLNGDMAKPAIVTNKHVLNNAVKIVLIFTIGDNSGNPLDDKHFSFTINSVGIAGIVFHPDKDVDLCALPIGRILNTIKHTFKTDIFYRAISKELIPTKENIDEFDALEEILMIGYPNGIWDSTNNKPILRRGVTATHPKNDYCGKKEIVIDASCFPGSSGSPVFIFNNGTYKSRDGAVNLGTKVILLGVLWGGPQYTAQGTITVINVPTHAMPITQSNIPLNLGFIIKAERILELEPLIK